MPVDIHGELEYRIPHTNHWHKCEVVHTLHNTVCLKLINPPGYRGMDSLVLESIPLDVSSYRNRPKVKKVGYGPFYFNEGGHMQIHIVYDSEDEARRRHPRSGVARIEWEE